MNQHIITFHQIFLCSSRVSCWRTKHFNRLPTLLRTSPKIRLLYAFPAADLIENTKRYHDAYSLLLSVRNRTTSIIPIFKHSAVASDETRTFITIFLITRVKFGFLIYFCFPPPFRVSAITYCYIDKEEDCMHYEERTLLVLYINIDGRTGYCHCESFWNCRVIPCD